MLAAVLIGAVAAVAVAIPLAWKWQLGVRRAAVAAVAVAAIAAAVVVAVDGAVGLDAAVAAALTWFLALALGTGLLAYRFYRDPERQVPEGDDVVLSPADGEVVYVREARAGMLPVASKLGRDYTLQELTKTELASEDNVVIGIALSFLDVHVNRAPIAGRAVVLQRYPGRFGSLRQPAMVFENERATLVLERDEFQVAVVMIASRLVRRIVTYVSEGAEVAAGQRIGMIRFGSQVDVVLPIRDGLDVLVQPGDRVVAGETVIARLGAGPAQSERELARAEPA